MGCVMTKGFAITILLIMTDAVLLILIMIRDDVGGCPIP